jgi:starch synthase (maltosyl-transferring)
MDRDGGSMELFGSDRFLFNISRVFPTAPPNDASVLERPNVKHLSATAIGGSVGRRYVIEDIYPSLEGGRFPVKRIAGEPVDVWAYIFRDGHDVAAPARQRPLGRAHDAPAARPL